MLYKNKVFVDRFEKEYNANRASEDERRAAMIASAKDPVKAAEFAAARVQKVYLNWLANSTALDLFEYVALTNDQRPILVSETDQSYNVLEINQHGTPAADSFINLDTDSIMFQKICNQSFNCYLITAY